MPLRVIMSVGVIVMVVRSMIVCHSLAPLTKNIVIAVRRSII
jgi:hypothetical protein